MTPRARAIAEGKTRYFNGEPCRHGHIAERAVSNSGCCQCAADARSRPDSRAKQMAYTKKHYQENKVEYRQSAQKWVAENADKVKEYQRKFYCVDGNKEKHNAKTREWQKRNPERHSANIADWRARNPEKYRAIALNRRARVAASGGDISGEDVKRVVRRQNGKCAVCGAKGKLEMDHIMPLALGGGGEVSNFQGLCRSCNRRKHAKHPIDFNRSRGLLL